MTRIGRLTVIAFLLSSNFVFAWGQTPAPRLAADQAQTLNEKTRTAADETFDLNIDQRRIVWENFSASTAVEIVPDNRGLDLQIGVALSAARIDALLVKVYGRVRFRGRLDRILDVLKLRPSAPRPSD